MARQHDDIGNMVPWISRRGFLGGCSAMLAAGLYGGARQAIAQTATSQLVGRLVFAFPGTPEVGSLLGARGAGLRLDALPTGGLSVAADPVTIAFSSSMAPAFYEWFIGAARPTINTPAKDILIIGVNLEGQELYRLTLGAARVAQVTWPRLGFASEALRFGATLVPATAALNYQGSSTPIQPSPKGKILDAVNFRIAIQGLEIESARVLAIDSFTQRLMPLPGASSAVVSHDSMILRMPVSVVGAFAKWQAEMLNAKAPERSGVLQFLSSDMKVAGQALLAGLSVQKIEVAPNSGPDGSTGTASIAVSLNVRAIELDKGSFR
jgi:hypothetical protein